MKLPVAFVEVAIAATLVWLAVELTHRGERAGDRGGVDHATGLGRERRAEKEDVGLREDGGERLRATEPFDSGPSVSG